MKQLNNRTMKTPLLLESLFSDKDSLSLKLRQIIFIAAKEAIGDQLKIEDIKIEHPLNENYGDYSTNLALILAGRLRMKSFDIAGRLKNKLSEYIRIHQTISDSPDSKHPSDGKIIVSDILENVTIAQPGFVNLMLQNTYLITLIDQLPKKENGVISTSLEGRKIAVEYTDPNPFKEFHLGHLYSNVIGESISRLFEACGATVWRGDFYGDAGMHIAKSLYGLLAKLKNQNAKIKNLKGEEYKNELKKELAKLEKLSIKERQNFLGKGYALGVNKYDEDKEVAEEIKDINYLVYVAAQEVLKKNKGWQPIVNYRQYVKGREDRLLEIALVYEAGLKWSLEYFETIYKRLGTKFDGYYPESWVGEYGMKMVEKGLSMGVLEKSEGTIVYRGERDGLHTRVFVNKLGLPTYEAKDLGLAYAKYQDFKYDLSINVFGREIDEYYKVVKAAMKKIEPTLGEKAYHIPHGMVKLPEGKMSSRTGTVVTFAWLLDEAKKYVLEIMKKSHRNILDTEGVKDTSEVARRVYPVRNSSDGGGINKEMNEIIERVALGAIRYALLKNSPENDVVFDFGKSVSFEGDSGPYLQYTYTRCRSVLRKASQGNTSKVAQRVYPVRNSSDGEGIGELNLNPEELSLLRSLYRFPEVVSEAARTLSPNLVCSFLFDLAQKYNLFYQKHSILNIKHRTKNMKQESAKNTPGVTGTGSPGVEESVKESIIRFRLFLTSATAQVIQKGLFLLGINTVERM